MRFLDANVFIYAYYKPKKRLSEKEEQMKKHAKRIIGEVSQGKEEVMLTVVHLSEVANILKHGIQPNRLASIILDLFMVDTLRICEVSREEYFAAAELGDELKLDPNDALAVDTMRANNIREIYSFDEDFDQIEGISRLPKLQVG